MLRSLQKDGSDLAHHAAKAIEIGQRDQLGRAVKIDFAASSLTNVEALIRYFDGSLFTHVFVSVQPGQLEYRVVKLSPGEERLISNSERHTFLAMPTRKTFAHAVVPMLPAGGLGSATPEMDPPPKEGKRTELRVVQSEPPGRSSIFASLRKRLAKRTHSAWKTLVKKIARIREMPAVSGKAHAKSKAQVIPIASHPRYTRSSRPESRQVH